MTEDNIMFEKGWFDFNGRHTGEKPIDYVMPEPRQRIVITTEG